MALLLILSPPEAMAQSFTIKGQVVDNTGESVIGASVVEKGNATNGTITDFDGNFEPSDREHSYYFTYEYNVIYYDHYYAEISAEDIQYIKDLGAECVELPDIEPTN